MAPRPGPAAGRIQVMGSEAWKKTPEGYVLKVGLPGLKKEDVNVVVKQGLLQISVKSKKEPKEPKVTRIPFPKNAKAAKVKDSMENGVLTVTVPKLEEKKGKAKVEKKKR